MAKVEKSKKPFPVVMGMQKLTEEAALDLFHAMRDHFGWHNTAAAADEIVCKTDILAALDKLRRDLTAARKVVGSLSESLWQAWKAFGEEGPDAAEKFLRAVCIGDGIMNESGGRIARSWKD
jgi:hypothetical protein